MTPTATAVGTMIDDILDALRRVPPERLADILQFVEFIEYQTAADAAEDEALWAAVQATQADRQKHPEDMTVLRSPEEIKAFLDGDE